MIRLLFVLVLGLWLAAAVQSTASAIEAVPAFATEPAADWFRDGRAAYERGDYRAAQQLFERAAAAVPTSDEYHYWLGKSCGRLAERASWLSAVKLARRTRTAFEAAVALNPDNRAALEDLARYYADAPGFLGGDPAKAAAIRTRLQSLPASATP